MATSVINISEVKYPPNKLPLPRLQTTIGSSIGSTSSPTCYVITSSPLPRDPDTPQHGVPSPAVCFNKFQTPHTTRCLRISSGTTSSKKTPKALTRSAEATRCKRKIDFAYAGLSKSKCESIAKRNARERNRVKQVNNGFEALRDHLPLDGVLDRSKISKVETLRNAIEYIKQLNHLLQSDESQRTYDAMQYTFQAASDPAPMSVDIPYSGVNPYVGGSFRDLLLSPTLSIDSTGRSTDGVDWMPESPSPPVHKDLQTGSHHHQNEHNVPQKIHVEQEYHMTQEHHVMPQQLSITSDIPLQDSGQYARWFQ